MAGCSHSNEKSIQVKKQVLVSVDPWETRVALLEQAGTPAKDRDQRPAAKSNPSAGYRVAELYIERRGSRSIVGNVYKGKVDNVIDGLEAAFIDIGLEKNAFLHIDEMVLTNVLGAAYTIRATFHAIRAGKGHFLLTGSVAGRIAIPGSLYSSTKWAVTGMGQSLRGELAGSGARVTVIEPGIVDTPFWDKSPGDGFLSDDDIAGIVLNTISQPPHVDINEVLVRPTSQTI